MASPSQTPAITVPQSPADRAPRALLFFLSDQLSYRRPLFSNREVFAGPDTKPRLDDPDHLSIRTPTGAFDVNEVLRQLPADRQPEIVVVKADATGRNFPRNLHQIKCPKVLVVGDTHHLKGPISRVIHYAQSEPFDRVVLDHTRHHARFFIEAGLPHVHWLPAVDYGFVPQTPAKQPRHALTFVGQSGKFHPYRRHILEQLRSAGLPLETLTAPLHRTAEIYANSQMTLNISLNGDLNLRVFEALSAGGFLLTDRLPEDSGLPLLFESGVHLETWQDLPELKEKISHYLSHPRAARNIAQRGQAEIMRAHHPNTKLREFYDLVFDGRENPRYRVASAARTISVGPQSGPNGLLPAYEVLQELHRTSRKLVISCRSKSPELVRSFLNLPRCEVQPWGEMALDLADPLVPCIAPDLPAHHVLWWDDDAAELPAALAHFNGGFVVAANDSSPTLLSWGFTAIAPACFQLTRPANWLQTAVAARSGLISEARLTAFLDAVDRSDDALLIADLAAERQFAQAHALALDRAIRLDRNCLAALLRLSSLFLDSGSAVSTAMVLSEAARIAPLPEAIEALRQNLLSDHAGAVDLQDYLARSCGYPPTKVGQPRRVLLITNLFPPEELGGYGRMMWEFVHGLSLRGHEVKVLCGAASYLRKDPDAAEIQLEPRVARSLRLQGEWRDGAVKLLGSAEDLQQIAAGNTQSALQTIAAMEAEVVLLGNIDLLGIEMLHTLLRRRIPVIHALANARPGYSVAHQPNSARYWIASCSDWNATVFREAGYRAARIETVYPGARIDRFFRFFLPDTAKLRIAYASLVLPYKGAHILVQALVHLHQAGIPFSAEIAGDSTDPSFVQTLQTFARENGMEASVKFTGFLGRQELAALYARSNVLVFPSQFPEPFGISQVEALAAGLVVVSSGTGGAAEIIRDGENGLLFPAADARVLAGKLAQLARDPDLFLRLQQAGQASAVAFAVGAAVEKLECLIADITAADHG